MLLTEENKTGQARALACRHCGAPFPDEKFAATGFCCSGCAYVFRLVHEHGLDAYYKIKDPVTAPADSVVFQPRDYSWLRDAQKAAADASGDRIPELTLDVQGISCAGCVWLIERLFMQEKGVREIIVNAQLGSARIRWMKDGGFDAGEWARRLQAFGYLLGPAGDKPRVLESNQLVRRIGLCGAFALNVMLFALPAYFGMRSDFEYAGLFRILSLVFATLSVMAGGSYFIGRAVMGIRSGVLHIDLPIAIGIVAAYGATLAGWLFNIGGFFYPDFVASFIVLMLIGRWAQVAAVERNRQRILRQQEVPARIHLASGGEVGREKLEIGQVIRISRGQTVPVECQVEGEARAFSLASITGESAPRVFLAGQRVPAGAVCLDRAVANLKVLQPWSASLLAQLLAPTERAGFRHAMMERVVKGYIIGIIGGAFLAAVGWWLASHSLSQAGTAAIAVLVVSCPCAIGLALPLADEMATASMRSAGVFVRENELWSKLGRVRNILFDKTGTLTLENPILMNPEKVDGLAPEARQALLALVQDNLHPIGRCLHEYLLGTGGGEALPGQVEEAVGQGVRLGTWTLGRSGWSDSGESCEDTVLACKGVPVARFRFRDSARPGAREDLARIQELGQGIYILSGDREGKVTSMASSLGLPADHAVSELSPQGKADWIREHAPDNALMLGDGANDSLAFDSALCRGTPVIHRGILENKADFYYLRQGIGGIRELISTGRRLRRVQTAIIVFSVAYNVVAAGFAATGHVNPLVAAVLMPASSLASLAIVTVGMQAGRRA